MQQIAHELIRLREHEAHEREKMTLNSEHEREKIVLRFEMELLRAGRQLPAGKPDEQKEAQQWNWIMWRCRLPILRRR